MTPEPIVRSSDQPVDKPHVDEGSKAAGVQGETSEPVVSPEDAARASRWIENARLTMGNGGT